MYRNYENEKIRENNEKDMFGSSARELFFQLNRELENRVQEMKEKFTHISVNEAENLFVETLLVKKEDIFKFYGGFYPIIRKKNEYPDDTEENIFLEDVFLEMPYYLIGEVENYELEGWICIGEENFEVKVRLEKDRRYESKLRELYSVCRLNGQKWNTLNLAHIQRMYRVRLVEYEFEMTVEILNGIRRMEYEISYSSDLFNENILRNMELLWNIEERQVLSSIFVRPAKIDISFEYVMKFGKDEKILVKNNGNYDILCTHIENGDELHIISKNGNETLWNIFSVKSSELCRNILKLNLSEDERSEYTYFTNRREISFIDNLKSRHGNDGTIESAAELEKMFSDYKFLRNRLLFSGISFDGKTEDAENLYDCNYFIENGFNRQSEKKIMNILIKCEDRDKYTADMISFIVSAAQQKIPGYRCQGVVYE